jgi:hypothetical protein
MALLDRDPACLLQLPASLVQQINHTYYKIGAMLDEFAECALIHISSEGRGGTMSVPLSHCQHFCFCRASY